MSEQNETAESKEIQINEELGEKTKKVEVDNESKEIQISEEAAPQNEKLIEELKQNLASCEDKLKRSLADFINLERKTKTDIENGVTEKIDKFMLKFLTIYDDLTRAAQVLKKENPNAAGLDSILKNIDALLAEYGITQIEALGEIFDPNLHEAVSVVEDAGLDDNTITKEIRKGYISHKRTLRPTLVEISKKPQSK